MIVAPGSTWVTEFTTASFATGAATDATGTPVGVLAVNGVDNAATVTVTNRATGRYSASVTIPAAAAIGDEVAMAITATVGGVAGAGIVAQATVAEMSAAGSGARTVVVTVTDGASPLQYASVRLTKSGITYVLTTSALGVATFSLDDGTYALAVSLAGWAFTPTMVVVDGNEAVTAAMSQVVIPAPTEPDGCVVYTYARDQHGTAAPGVVVTFALDGVSALSAGSAYDGDSHTATSAADGLVQMQLPQGAWCSVQIHGEKWQRFIVPAAASYQLPAILI